MNGGITSVGVSYINNVGMGLLERVSGSIQDF
jgi:hypothetical protein